MGCLEIPFDEPAILVLFEERKVAHAFQLQAPTDAFEAVFKYSRLVLNLLPNLIEVVHSLARHMQEFSILLLWRDWLAAC